MFHVLLALAGDDLHGYAILKEVASNREIYHGSGSLISSILVLGVVAVVTYKLTIRVFKRITSH